MVIYSATGNATFIEPSQGFQNPKLAQVFFDKTTLTNNHSRSKLAMGIAGSIIGTLFLVISIWCFLLRRRHKMVAPPKPSEMPAPTPIEPQELHECGLYELHDPRMVFELPSPPIELDASVSSQRRKPMGVIEAT